MTATGSLRGTEYDLSRKKLNEIVKALRDCGTEEVVKLPKIVVIGNQSAGKSSLIEAISRIKVPRASGTCTRCPMEVVLSCSDSKTWHCKVSLRFEHNEVTGQHLGVFPFGETDSINEVPNLLRGAQLAILNPGKDSREFVNISEDKCKDYRSELKFSRNTVVLEITGADVDVTFIDLPGIISNTEKVRRQVSVLICLV
jgi:GTPase SAR1 family protein